MYVDLVVAAALASLVAEEVHGGELGRHELQAECLVPAAWTTIDPDLPCADTSGRALSSRSQLWVAGGQGIVQAVWTA